MINKESGLPANLNNWHSRTSQSNYMLTETYEAMEWFRFADYIIK